MKRLGFIPTAALSTACLCGIAFYQSAGNDIVPKVAAPSGRVPVPALPADPRDVHRPGRVPDRIILTWNGDPAHSQAVTWRTDATVTRGVAQIAVADAGPGFAKSASAVTAVTSYLKTDLNEASYHSAQFTDRSPAIRYAYRVGDGTNWSEWNHFRTASDKSEPFSFIYFGDAQNDIKSMWSRVVREAHAEAPKARFMIHAGDLISNGDDDAQWGEWHGAGGWLNAMVPSIATPGNHEYVREMLGVTSHLSKHWRPQFAFPENGPPGLEETVFFIDY